jgi:hypothetical protein
MNFNMEFGVPYYEVVLIDIFYELIK